MERDQQHWNREGSIFSSAIDSQTNWNDLISKICQRQGNVDDFKKLMYKMQYKRRGLVLQLLLGCEEDSKHENPEQKSFIEVIDDCLKFLQTIHETLSDSKHSVFQKEILSTNNEKLMLNVKDEILGIRKDLVLLDKIHSIYQTMQHSNSEGILSVSNSLKNLDFVDILAPYHPINSQEFIKEHANCVSFLKKFIDPIGMENQKPILITDWDGTMKDYCSQYATNLQPIYSAISMAKFSQTYTRLTAVLTAGPLRGPGILDLISLPKDGPILFGGSWGREWWLGGKRVVHDEDISDEGLNALERLSDEMATLLSKQEFSHFQLLGSGFQRKVDRLTLGVQTVFNHVHPDLSTKYQDAVKERVHRVDPSEQFLHFEPSTGLEVEVIVHNDGIVWNKANGMARLVDTLGDTLQTGKVLICGDTNSDVPMLTHGIAKNPEGLMALFVTSDAKLQQRVIDTIRDSERCCFVSTPDVIHAAMVSILKNETTNH